MSVRDLQSNPETAAEPDDLVIRRMVRALDYAEGFWLGFAKSNTTAQRRRLAATCKDLLEPLKIRVLEIELTEQVTDLLPVLRERIAQEESSGASQHKLAIFVHGLEHSIPSREAYPPLLSSLNLNRELFRQQVPHPLVLWLPDYALTALARKAPDFWAWRSGLYEFAPEREAAEQSLEAVRGQTIHIIANLSEQAKRERLVMLKGLLEDYRELGDGTHERKARASILGGIGAVHRELGELTEASQAQKESLTICRNLHEGAGEATALHNLGRIAQDRGNIEEARRLYSESLQINNKLNDQRGGALAIWGLGSISLQQESFDEARKLLQEALETFRRLGDQSNAAGTLNELAILAQEQGELEEARRLYSDSLEIRKRLGNESGVAGTLHNMSLLAEDEGNKVEAARLLREALSIFERLGSPTAKVSRQMLARVESREDGSD